MVDIAIYTGCVVTPFIIGAAFVWWTERRKR